MKLKPCPFCGGKASVNGTLKQYVVCRSKRCWAFGPDDDPDGAKWNRRPRAKKVKR